MSIMLPEYTDLNFTLGSTFIDENGEVNITFILSRADFDRLNAFAVGDDFKSVRENGNVIMFFPGD